jgi:disulfide bond formation protein DsbB
MDDSLAVPAGAGAEATDLDRWVARYGVYLALLAAWTAMLGSLFFSEVLGWAPCVLCWYQRILMYPIALFSVVALLAGNRSLPLYALTLSVPGIAVATYHYVYQKTTWFDTVHVCGPGVSCKGDYLGRGLVTIPFLALVAFVLVTLAMVAVWRRGGPVPPVAGRPWLPVVGTLAASVALMLLLMYVLPAARLQWLGP